MICQQKNKQLEQLKTRLSQKYNYLSPHEVEDCLNLAIKDYVYLRYPSSNNRPTIEKLEIDFYVSNWIYDRMIDILSRVGGTNLTSYRENGISFTYASSYIDPMLVAQITPKGSVPK